MTFWREQQLNNDYRREQMQQADKARELRDLKEQKTDTWSLFTRRHSQ